MIIKADLHTHTNLSIDGRQTLEQLTKAARAKGLKAVAVTDHGRFTRLPLEMNGVLLIPGCEFNGSAGHILGLFLDSPPDISGGTPQEVVKEIHRCGGIAVLAHPFQKPGKTEDDYPFPIEGVETANARATKKNRCANRMAADFARKYGLMEFGGSDAHSAAEVGNAYTVIECKERTLQSIKEGILCGNAHAELKRRTPYRMIGLSQLQRRRRLGGLKNRLIGWAYLIKCIALDIKK